MRQRDEKVSYLDGKASKTLTFDKLVLNALEKRAEVENTNCSQLANFLLKELLLNDQTFHSFMAKHYNLKMQMHLFMRDQQSVAEDVSKVKVGVLE